MDALKTLLDELDTKYKEKDGKVIVRNCLINFVASMGLKGEVKFTIFPWSQLVMIFILTGICFSSGHEIIKFISVFFSISISLNLIISHVFVFFVKTRLYGCKKLCDKS